MNPIYAVKLLGGSYRVSASLAGHYAAKFPKFVRAKNYTLNGAANTVEPHTLFVAVSLRLAAFEAWWRAQRARRGLLGSRVRCDRRSTDARCQSAWLGGPVCRRRREDLPAVETIHHAAPLGPGMLNSPATLEHWTMKNIGAIVVRYALGL